MSSRETNDTVVEVDPVAAVTLSWQNVSFSIPDKSQKVETDKVLLDNVSGIVKPGEVIAIMGASGAGKTTLLNVLAGRISNEGKLSGTILVNGQERSKSTWQRVIAYVEQDDLMFENLTVRETLMYAARLRLPRSVSEEQKAARVDKIINELALVKCRDTYIGGPSRRGISGGERKRVSIGIELVTNPSLLFLDEPSSGLDSFTALNLIETMKKIAVDDNKTVVMTIHQPRESILDQIDKIILLSAGKVVYAGPVAGAISHFDKMGYPVPDRVNPADYFLDVMTIDLRSEELHTDSLERVKKFQSSWEPEKIDLCSVDANISEGTFLPGFASAIHYEYWILFERNIQDLLRDPASLGATIGQAVVNTLILGFVFFRMDLSNEGIQNRLGMLFFTAIQLTFGNVMPTIAVFTTQRDIIRRERASRSYRAITAYLAKLSSQLPLVIFATILFAVPVYWMVGLQADVVKFFTWLAIVVVHAFTATCLGIMISSGVPNVRVGQIIGPTVVVIFLVFGGQVVNVDTVPVVLRWIKWISMILYSYSALAMNEMSDLTFSCPQNSPPGCSIDGLDVIENFDLVIFSSLWFSVLMNFCLGVSFIVLGYILFNWRSSPMLRLK